MRLVHGEQISCRSWSGAKSPIDGNAICPLEERTTDAKKVEYYVVACVYIKVAYLEFFPELQIFSAPELQVELFTIISRKTLT